MTQIMHQRSSPWIWYVCALMMVATVINYMDRMTLNLLAEQVRREFSLSKEQYGQLELGFGIAFAAGSLVFGWLIDRIGVYWLYPLVLSGWSTVGFLAGLSAGYHELLVLRILLGFFESGHFPCALKAVQIMMAERDRPLANSLLQSGSALGAILAPQAVKLLLGNTPEGWRQPFLIIGAGGGTWVIFWLTSLRPRDLPVAGRVDTDDDAPFFKLVFSARFLALLIVIICITMTWQFFRVWLPMFLCDARGYSTAVMLDFITFYYLAAYIGSLAAGSVSGWLCYRGLSPLAAQISVYAGCCGLTALTVLAAFLPAQPLLLAVLLLVGSGSLGVYTLYLSLMQNLSRRHQGKISGLLSTIVWLLTAPMHPLFGTYLDHGGHYNLAVGIAGCLPAVSLVVLVYLWNRAAPSAAQER